MTLFVLKGISLNSAGAARGIARQGGVRHRGITQGIARYGNGSPDRTHGVLPFGLLF